MFSASRLLRIPHTFIFLSGIILFCSTLTYILPSGQYARKSVPFGSSSRTVIETGTYTEIPKHFSMRGFVLGEQKEGRATPIGALGFITAIPRGMSESADLIFFVLIIGGTFSIIRRTGTIRAIIFKLLDYFGHSMPWLTIILLSLFALLASFLGMGMEFIPLIPIFLLLSREMGYDRLIGFSLLTLGTFVGWSAAISNPFNLQIAQKIAELPLGSGMFYRACFLVVTVIITASYLVRYGNRIRRDPRRSIMADDKFDVEFGNDNGKVTLQHYHILIVVSAFIILALVLYAVQTMGWGLIEMSGGFLAVGVTTALIGRLSADEAAKAFTKGLEVMIVPALVVGFARGIQVVMRDGLIIDTILHYSTMVLQHLPTLVAAEGMLVFQTFLNFFIPSASGQALVSMPLMTPMADLLGISRQVAVLAFVFGDGFSNMIIPTNGILLAMLGIAGIPYDKWLKFVLPLFLQLMAAAFVFVAIAVLIGY
jgi:uncharacterized ion transporter superfamily protein YfcC